MRLTITTVAPQEQETIKASRIQTLLLNQELILRLTPYKPIDILQTPQQTLTNYLMTLFLSKEIEARAPINQLLVNQRVRLRTAKQNMLQIPPIDTHNKIILTSNCNRISQILVVYLSQSQRKWVMYCHQISWVMMRKMAREKQGEQTLFLVEIANQKFKQRK